MRSLLKNAAFPVALAGALVVLSAGPIRAQSSESKAVEIAIRAILHVMGQQGQQKMTLAEAWYYVEKLNRESRQLGVELTFGERVELTGRLQGLAIGGPLPSPGTLAVVLADELVTVEPTPDEVQPSVALPRSGYAEFRHRVEMVYDRNIRGPVNMQNVRTPEAKCIGYLMHHCVNHYGNREGYANLRSRLDGSKDDIRRDLRGRPGAAAHWLLYLVDHCVNNPPTPEGYQELHRRLSQECWPQAEGQLKGERRVESDWVAYLIWHIVGNPATL